MWYEVPEGAPKRHPSELPDVSIRSVPHELAVVGYIPYSRNLSGEYRLFDWPVRTGFSALFASGNPDPAPVFSGLDGLNVFVGGKQFRAVLAITVIEVHVDPHGSIAGLSFLYHKPWDTRRCALKCCSPSYRLARPRSTSPLASTKSQVMPDPCRSRMPGTNGRCG
jgi:hypothetical protein